MMLDKVVIKAPAKINLFLRVLNKRDDGYHNIKSGVTFINLYDEINIIKSNSMSIQYSGTFAPSSGFYADCIIKKTLKFINLYKAVNLEIHVIKNIPVKAGLGSASSNSAGLIKGLEKLQIIKPIVDFQSFGSLGADIPVFLYGKDSLVGGIGDQIIKKQFPKYYFLVVKPEISFSTEDMYKKIQKNFLKNDKPFKQHNDLINDYDNGNDFEKIIINEKNEIKKLLNFLSNIEECIFARMTGTGSCCFAVFEKLDIAHKAQQIFRKKFPKLWSFVGENNELVA